MNHLERLVGRNEEIDMELRRITKSKFLPANLPSIFIGVHVRFGDFPDRVEGSDQINFRQPIEWYVEGIQQLRIVLKGNIPAIVFSDGMDQELEPLLKLENVVRSPQSEAISDLFAIARSLVLFTSRSSFSLFGAFLGQVPSIWYEGKKDIYRKGYLKNDDTELSIEWMPGQLFPDAFLTELKTRIDCKK